MSAAVNIYAREGFCCTEAHLEAEQEFGAGKQ